MIRFILAFFVLVLAFPQQSFANDIETDSTIKAVTVYTNRAKLTREAVVDVPAGGHTVIFKDLPAGIMTDTLRVEGKAASKVTFGALAHKQTVKSDLAAPREKELNDQLEKLRDQRKAAEAEQEALQAQQDFLGNLGKQAQLRSDEEIAQIDLKPDQWAAAAEAIRSGMADSLGKGLALDMKIRGINKEIQKVQTELAQIRTGQKVTWEVRIPVEVVAATKLTVDLSYQVNNATWQPLYDARLDTASGKLDLVQYGSVRQQTGEDWSDVDLTLSTAQPQRGAGLPPLNSMWVNIWENQYAQRTNALAARAPMAKMAMVADASMEMDSMMAGAAPPGVMAEQAATFAQANIETGGFVSEYKITGPADVPADGTETKLMVGAFDTESEMQVQVKPQINNEAYLVARTKLKGEAPILPGQVNLFRDGAYVGQSHLPLLRPGEEKDLSFGIDDQVAVKRHIMKDERSEDGVISKDSTLERHFMTTVQNLHSRAVKVIVMETVPVAKDEKIDVDIIKNATTPGYETDRDNVKGLLAWTLDMQSKDSKDIKLGWKVSWPKGSRISGL